MAGFKYSGLAPDETTSYSSNYSKNVGNSDYAKLISKYLGGGGGGGGRTQGASGTGGRMSFGGTGAPFKAGPTAGAPSHGQPYTIYDELQWQQNQELAKANALHSNNMDLARMNIGGNLAQTQMQMDLQKQIEMQRIADNEKNRQHQLLQQQRSAQQSAYEQDNDYYKRYGI